MTFVLAYNPTDGPVVTDTAGRMLGGREWGPVDASDDAVKEQFAAGRLVQVDAPGKQADPAAVAAAKEAERLTARANELHANGSKPALTEAARDAGLIGDEETPTVSELVALLVRTDVPIPTSEPAKPAKES